jgi:hypothetical protein
MIVLPSPPECWDYKLVPPYLGKMRITEKLVIQATIIAFANSSPTCGNTFIKNLDRWSVMEIRQ